jgi:hypothetical protein
MDQCRALPGRAHSPGTGTKPDAGLCADVLVTDFLTGRLRHRRWSMRQYAVDFPCQIRPTLDLMRQYLLARLLGNQSLTLDVTSLLPGLHCRAQARRWTMPSQTSLPDNQAQAGLCTVPWASLPGLKPASRLCAPARHCGTSPHQEQQTQPEHTNWVAWHRVRSCLT